MEENLLKTEMYVLGDAKRMYEAGSNALFYHVPADLVVNALQLNELMMHDGAYEVTLRPIEKEEDEVVEEDGA